MKISLKVQPLKPIKVQTRPLVPMKGIGLGQPIKLERSLKPQGMNFGGGQSIMLGGGGRSETLPDAGGMPPPTRQQIEHFRQNRDKIIGPIVKASLRQHPQDVLHGSRSLDMLLPNYPREPNDWDIYSPQERKRAIELERAVDRKVGADIMETKYCPVPKVTSGPDEPGTSKDLYRLVTPTISNDADIDVMDKPAGIKTQKHKSITHESLREAYVKAFRRKKLQPIKAGKAIQDARAIEEYWQRKGLQPPQLDMEQGGAVWEGPILRQSSFRLKPIGVL